MKNRCRHGLHNFPNLDEEIAVQVRFGIRTNAGGKGFEGEGVCNSVLDQRIPNSQHWRGWDDGGVGLSLIAVGPEDLSLADLFRWSVERRHQWDTREEPMLAAQLLIPVG